MSRRSARRSTNKSVNYAKEQEFSDADVFEDSDEEPAATPKRAPVRRKPTAAATPMDVDEPEEDAFRPTKPVYTERGYDPSLPPIRERFSFLPEYEPDGSPRIDLIVGRRPVDEGGDTNVDDQDEDVEKKAPKPKAEEKKNGRRRSKKRGANDDASGKDEETADKTIVDYEYLIKYKGRSYLHLEWKTGADLESMNKSAKTIYRRYLKRIAANTDEDIEDPNFDPSYAEPQKIIDDAEKEITVELTDAELIAWEKEKEKMEADNDGDVAIEGVDGEEESGEEEDVEKKPQYDFKGGGGDDDDDEEEEIIEPKEWGDDEEVDFSSLSMERIKMALAKDGPYYPKFKGCNNPYRDGYVTEPPRKPRPSYLFFQSAMRSYFQKRKPAATQAELMSILGSTWGAMSDSEQEPFIQLAREEAAEYEKERVLMEKAQRPNEMWQPLRRCLMVLNKITNDGFSTIFLEPVDTSEFTDYEEIIDQPMDLGTVRQRLANRKYQIPEQFARDVRKVWKNCKIYNRHGSAIWHVADYMSKQFERLYHAWVLEFRERYLRWVQPKARPWEPTCRQCDGKCGTPDDKMVLCDHCDAAYGLQCLKPPLESAPTGVWHCPDCRPKLHSVRGVRMLSAVPEHAARKRAELGDTPKRTIKKRLFLVKWMGLGYEYCTWESKDDIGNSDVIDAYFNISSSSANEPSLERKVVEDVLAKAKHIDTSNAGGSPCVADFRTQMYAQTRAFQYLKFGLDVPEVFCDECGPSSKALRATLSGDTATSRCSEEVHRILSEMTYEVGRGVPTQRNFKDGSLPLLLTGEYDAVIPITSKGLMMNVGEINGAVSFLGYRAFPDGSKGPAEIQQIIRGVGDRIISVDGTSTMDKTFKDVILMLRESGKNKHALMRFLESRFTVCEGDITSVGFVGRYVVEALRREFAAKRKELVIRRKQELIDKENQTEVKKEDDDDGASSAPPGSENESDSSEGEFEPDPESDGDDDELVAEAKQKQANLSLDLSKANPALGAVPQSDAGVQKNASAPPVPSKELETYKRIQVETTRSLAYHLIDEDVGYSSDEGGLEDSAYYIDGVDTTFTTRKEIEELIAGPNKSTSRQEAEVYDEENSDDEDLVLPTILPVKQREFTSLGERAKLCAAALLTETQPSKEVPQISVDDDEDDEMKAAQSADGEDAGPAEPKKLSDTKVEQVSANTNECVRVWACAEDAAATLQIPLVDIKRVLAGDYDEDLGDEVRGFTWRFAAEDAEVTGAVPETSGNAYQKSLRESWLEFRDRLYDPADPHVYKGGNRLRDYQVEGVNWLASTWYRKHGCILADEMGLGKTVQIVTYIEHIFRVEKVSRPFLVVVPLSTLEHWRREFEGWTDMVCCVYHDRQRVWRDVLREYEWYYRDRPHTSDFLKFDVLVTTYDTLIGDFDVIGQIPFRIAVVDEAHRLRNQKGKLLECMKEISAKGTMEYGFQSRVLMSGTPLQNDLTELWTLLNFIEPYKFPDLNEFQHQYGNMANREQVESLQRKISPFMLRRVKEDVAKDIPAKEETVIDVELTSIQKQYYRAIFEHNHAFLNLGASRTNAPKLMNIQMELRKVCNHPALLEGVEHREHEKQFKVFLSEGQFEGKTPEEQQEMMNEHVYVMSSGKMVLLDKLLPKLRQEGHKVLVFSQMVRMLDLISEYCEFRSFPYERLDGRVRGTDRQKSIDRFEREDNSFLFLLSTRAGGVGINLTAADVCIIFDSDWNPQNDVQAQARCHRIGQTKDVRIYRLVTSRTFEQEMFDRASKKLGLEQAILGTFGQDDDDDKPTNKEMEQLLKKGAYALIEDESDEIGKAFCADDIESILAKRTRTRVVEGTKTASWLNKQGMVVSKSKFTADGASSAVDVDDPLFWQKVMPGFVTPTIMLQKMHDLSDAIDGVAPGSRKKRGRGRWREQRREAEEAKKKAEEAAASAAANPLASSALNGGPASSFGGAPANAAVLGSPHQTSAAGSKADSDADNKTGTDDENDDDSDSDSGEKKQLSEENKKKVAKFMSELKSMLDDMFDNEDGNDSIPASEKAVAQKLLLTISVKERMFTEEQRLFARTTLKRLEGNRRRRCRTSDAQPKRRMSGSRKSSAPGEVINEKLRIGSSKKTKRRRRTKKEMEADRERERLSKAQPKKSNPGDSSYLVHSDDEADWSDVGEDMYRAGKATITRKEIQNKRQWAENDEPMAAASRNWPPFPRNVVSKVLRTVMDEVIKHDKAKGGIFSVPVPHDDFPEYYDQISTPMDYGTMSKKLEKGYYRSVQAMQKDFALVIENCLQFNSSDSDIVLEARQQALMRPNILRKAALKHNLFLDEDGVVYDIVDEDDDKNSKKKATGKKGPVGITLKKRARKSSSDADSGDDAEPSKKKPRIRLSMGAGKESTEFGAKVEGLEGADAGAAEHMDVDGSDNEKQTPGNGGAATVDKSVSSDPGQKYLNVAHWKSEKETLDGTFEGARKLLTKYGPWSLPSELLDSFQDVATAMMTKMGRLDRYSVFATAVTEEEAPDYYELIKVPMTFSKMNEKIKNGAYGEGNKAAAKFYEDFVLIFDNCRLYNDEEGDVIDEAARMLALVPETYAASVESVAARKK